MPTTLAESIKLWGGVAGLLSAAVLIYDRLSSSRPRIGFSSERDDSPFANKEQFLTIENPSRGPMFIDRLISTSQNVLVSKFEDNSDVMGHRMAEMARAIIPPGSTARCSLTVMEARPPAVSLLLVFWSTGSGVMPHLPSFLILRPRKLLAIENDRRPGQHSEV